MNSFKPDETVPIPTKDILSWMFDHQKYDPDKPVSHHSSPAGGQHH
jgi:hypothetical protein